MNIKIWQLTIFSFVLSYDICITDHIHENPNFCLFTMCPVFKSSRDRHWSKSKEYFIRFTISLFHYYSLKFHACAHTELYTCCVTHLTAKNDRKFTAGIMHDSSLINPNNFRSCIWMMPGRTLSSLLQLLPKFSQLFNFLAA